MYRVIMTVHTHDQSPEGKQPTPHWLVPGRRVVCRGMTEQEATEYAGRLQRMQDAGSVPFVFTTYSVELDYPEHVV